MICEGAGSPAEINLRATDLANMGLARAANLPVVLVGDIDRGGLLAHLFGTLAVLEPADQKLVAGFVVNKFRGDQALLQPGLQQLEKLTGRPTYGVLPYVDELWLDTEDSLSVVATRVGKPQPPRGAEWLEVAAIRLPRTSNSTDVEALACEPGVLVRWATDPAALADADVVVVPGTQGDGRRPGLAARTRLGRRPSRATPRRASPCSASAGACRCCAGGSTTASKAGPAPSTGSACWTPTSSSARRRRCVAAARAMRSITARSAAAPRTTGHTSASAAARCTARTGTGCSTTTRSGGDWLTEAARASGRDRVRRSRRRQRARPTGRATRRHGRSARRPRRRRRRVRAPRVGATGTADRCQ